MFLLVAAHSADRSNLNRIQHRRDRTHIILAQQQPQQAAEMLWLPDGTAQHIIHLLQCRKQNLPELIEDLRAPVVTGGIILLCQSGKTLRKANIRQKSVKCLNLLSQVFCRKEAAAQSYQRGNGNISGAVQSV